MAVYALSWELAAICVRYGELGPVQCACLGQGLVQTDSQAKSIAFVRAICCVVENDQVLTCPSSVFLCFLDKFFCI